MIPALYLLTLAAMCALGWLVTAAKTRAFWLGLRRLGRVVVYYLRVIGGERTPACDFAEEYRGKRKSHRLFCRAARYKCGIPVFSNRVFTLP